MTEPTFELFYSRGGHGGAYQNLKTAALSAIRLLRGTPTESCIELHDRRFPFHDRRGRIATVTREELGMRIEFRYGRRNCLVIPTEDESEECGCCGCYHHPRFGGDCRQDQYRLPTWEEAEIIDWMVDELGPPPSPPEVP